MEAYDDDLLRFEAEGADAGAGVVAIEMFAGAALLARSASASCGIIVGRCRRPANRDKNEGRLLCAQCVWLE
jgi:hypothetical protein